MKITVLCHHRAVICILPFKIPMKNIADKVYQNRYFLLFVFLFAYIQSLYIRIAVRQEINIYTFTPEAALVTLVAAGVLFLIVLFFIQKWQKYNVLDTTILLKIFGTSLLIFVISMQLIGLIMALAFDKMEQNFNRHTLTLSLFSDFLNGIIYGSFFLTYYYYQHNKKQQLKQDIYNKALAESKINQLKTQLNPHFLFNNLNVLDQLIEEDKYQASNFLNEFADIYRYVLQSTDKELVHIDEEVDFARQYFKLIEHKYGSAYQLHIQHNHSTGFVVPLTLQILIENAIQHNLGAAGAPICIHIRVGENIFVTNNINLKNHNKPTSGRALNNLKEQYHLLSEKPIDISEDDNAFSVIIPIIYS